MFETYEEMHTNTTTLHAEFGPSEEDACKVIVDTAEVCPGVFETMTMLSGGNDEFSGVNVELDRKVDYSLAAAKQTFRSMAARALAKYESWLP